MGRGLHVGKKSSCIDKYEQKSGILSLLAKGDGAEVMVQRIQANEIVFINPSDVSETMEFFYILEGELEMHKSGGNVVLDKDDYFYVHHLNEIVQFYTKSDVSLLYVSTQPLFQYISSTIRDLTELAKKVEKKDMYTHSHIQRVRDYSVKIGNKLNLSKEKIENVVFASLFHDIGKVNVPDEVLNKPGSLTSEEFDLIKKHPGDGAAMVEETYYQDLGRIVEQHHERIDGSGYPNGIKGDEILIEAKIIAVADTFDAMTTDRPYRKGVSAQKAAQELENLKGIHYDEEVVNTFIDILKEEGVI